jgi:hypothetical protein
MTAGSPEGQSPGQRSRGTSSKEVPTPTRRSARQSQAAEAHAQQTPHPVISTGQPEARRLPISAPTQHQLQHDQQQHEQQQLQPPASASPPQEPTAWAFLGSPVEGSPQAHTSILSPATQQRTLWNQVADQQTAELYNLVDDLLHYLTVRYGALQRFLARRTLTWKPSPGQLHLCIIFVAVGHASLFVTTTFLNHLTALLRDCMQRSVEVHDLKAAVWADSRTVKLCTLFAVRVLSSADAKTRI